MSGHVHEPFPEGVLMFQVANCSIQYSLYLRNKRVLVVYG